MTTPATASSTAQRLRSNPCLLALPLAIAVPVAACGLFHRDFSVAVGNRMPNAVTVFANGGRLGEVGSNQTATFTVEEYPIKSVGNATSPTPVAQVTFSARDMATGVLSPGTGATLITDVTTYLDVAPCVLIGGGLAPPCVSVSSATTGSPGQTGSATPTCAFTLSESSHSFPPTGGPGSVTVNTASGCAWSATSNATWVTVVNGASGTGTGVVQYQVAANITGQERTTSLSIAGLVLTIIQNP